MTNTLGKILIVDDDEDVLISAKLLLKKHSNLKVLIPNAIPHKFLLCSKMNNMMLFC
ncbi:MAG: hypothetical protein R3C26_20710 [Calditrichia bacterium]